MMRLALLSVIAACLLSAGLASAEAHPLVVGSCTIYRAGSDERVTIYANDAPTQCATAIKDWSGSNAYWTTRLMCRYSCSAPPPIVCQMHLPGHATYIAVRDYGTQYSGRGLCGSLASNGWVDDPQGNPTAPSGVQNGDHTIQSPSGNLLCDISQPGNPASAWLYCIIVGRMEVATMRGSSSTITVTHIKSINGGASAKLVTLRYGHSVSGHGFTCTSLTTGMRCVLTASGRGFLASRTGVRRVGVH